MCLILLSGLMVLSCVALLAAQEASDTVDIASRRELFVDNHLIDRLDGAKLKLHEPRPAGVAIRHDQPWEGRHCAYVTVLKDDPPSGQAVYRAYYRGYPEMDKPQVTCYAESADGITWTKPDLRLHEVAGTLDNNVILTSEQASHATHNFCPFVDTRPGAPPEERYKAVGDAGTMYPSLRAFASADGVNWHKMREEPVLHMREGWHWAFDSQNVAFWSEAETCYLSYFRTFKTIGETRYRWISRSTSENFLTWTEPVEMEMGDAPPEQLYINGTHPYFRAPHIYIALPARLLEGRTGLTQEQMATLDLGPAREWHDCSDALFMTTRAGGRRYDRTFMEAFVRPGLDPGNWVSRANYPALGVVPTGEGEMSIYVQRHMNQPTARLERLTLRTDGFVSVNAPYGGGEMLTRPLTFAGRELEINFATSAAGSVGVEIQDEAGVPLEGFTLGNCTEIVGDQIERIVAWGGGSDVGKLSGKAIRLRFVMKDADLYAIRFRE